MADDSKPQRPDPSGPRSARQDRLAAALRENLAKRKAQARERGDQTAPKRDKSA